MARGLSAAQLDRYKEEGILFPVPALRQCIWPSSERDSTQ